VAPGPLQEDRTRLGEQERQVKETLAVQLHRLRQTLLLRAAAAREQSDQTQTAMLAVVLVERDLLAA
jgi:hypothetical protein